MACAQTPAASNNDTHATQRTLLAVFDVFFNMELLSRATWRIGERTPTFGLLYMAYWQRCNPLEVTTLLPLCVTSLSPLPTQPRYIRYHALSSPSASDFDSRIRRLGTCFDILPLLYSLS